jgi:2-polyprenyl-6-hydroxyphenyl methylase/3-demethylubiquinone-9 3-methyltransferase
VDFNKNCEIYRRKVLDVSGVPVYYYRCPACQFIFTTAMDGFTREDFLRDVYNEEYLVVDPDYADLRPRANAAMLSQMFAAQRPGRLLDYGAGKGVLAGLLRSAGFPLVEEYDPFVPEFARRPEGRFDCLVSFEVVEHATDPLGVFGEISGLLADPGLVVFSTLVQPADIDRQGLNWWYAGPRNGHVSLFSRPSLQKVADRLGLRFGSFNDNLHVLARGVPGFARHLFGA